MNKCRHIFNAGIEGVVLCVNCGIEYFCWKANYEWWKEDPNYRTAQEIAVDKAWELIKP